MLHRTGVLSVRNSTPSVFIFSQAPLPGIAGVSWPRIHSPRSAANRHNQNPARFFEMENQLGTVEQGSCA